jgi:hypothetical protein
MFLKDTRTKILNEILNGIKVIKLYAWEGAFEKNVTEVRDKEVDAVKKGAYLIGGTAVNFNAAPFIVSTIVMELELF